MDPPSNSHRSSKKKHSHKHDKSHHHHHSSKHNHSHSHNSKRTKSKSTDHDDATPTIDDYEDYWVEKEDPPEVVSVIENVKVPVLPTPARETWMEEHSEDAFGGFLTGTKKEPPVEKPDPEKPLVSQKELNIHLKAGLTVDQYPEQEKKTMRFGDSGSNWRMVKLKRVMQLAKDENRDLEQIGIERFGSLEQWRQVLEEREWLDSRKPNSSRIRDDNNDGSRLDGRYTRDGQRYQKPEEPREQRARTLEDDEVDEFGRTKKRTRISSPPKTPATTSTPIVSSSSVSVGNGDGAPILSKDELNRLNGKILKARMMGSGDLKKLEDEYEREKKRAENASKDDGRVVVLPTVDSRGKLTSLSTVKGAKKEKIETHDIEGRRLRYDYAGEKDSLEDLVRQEKAGIREDVGTAMADRILKDTRFSADHDYMDEHAEKIARVKERTEDQKRQLAIKDFKKTSQALDRCAYCSQDGKPPRAAVVSRGHRTFLALPSTAELTPGHCMIVPAQHTITSVECDDDVWDEIRNFQKCLLRMLDAQNQSCVFTETVLQLDRHRHTVIECIPLSREAAEDAPAYFQEALSSVESEWSQHKKLISTTKERGIRRSITKHLPYFHVWFGLDTGCAHVVEDEEKFPRYFGAEIVGGMCDLPPNAWRRPKRHDSRDDQRRVREFREKWDPWDWTKELTNA